MKSTGANTNGWNMITNEEVLELQKKHGIAPHKHSNGLMSCYECVCLVVSGKTSKQLSEELAEAVKKKMIEDDPGFEEYLKEHPL